MEIRHHGYLLTGDTEKAENTALEMAAKILETNTDRLKASPDFSFFANPSFTIDDARKVREGSSKKSFSGKGRVFVIKADTFTREASNALLKTLEEPMGLSRFFVITGSLENVLDTLRSRLSSITFYHSAELSKEREEFIKKFFGSSADGRIKMVQKISEDRKKTSDFLNGLEIFLEKRLTENFQENVIKALDDISRQRSFLGRRASSPKMILEHLSLTLLKL